MVTFKGNPVTLSGNEIKEGQNAPDFTVVNTDLKPVKFSDFRGRKVILSVVPSIDTPVCSRQTSRFNQEAEKLDAELLTISVDLPFAQKRFCQENEIKKAQLLSDYKDHEFGQAFGLNVKDLGLLARAVYVIDKDGKVAYREIVSEMTNEPDYDKALEAAKKLG